MLWMKLWTIQQDICDTETGQRVTKTCIVIDTKALETSETEPNETGPSQTLSV